jgi:hypothetical protein
MVHQSPGKAVVREFMRETTYQPHIDERQLVPVLKKLIKQI